MKLRILVVGWLILTHMAVAVSTVETNFDRYRSRSASELIQAGKQRLKNKNFSGAAKVLEALESIYPFESAAKPGLLYLAYAHYKLNDYGAAQAAMAKYIHLYPEDVNSDYIYYLRGVTDINMARPHLKRALSAPVVELDMSNLVNAFNGFSYLIHKFPHSKYVREARQKMLYIKGALIGHNLNVAQFYLDRQVNIGAINRAQLVLTKFAGSSRESKCQALRILIKAYGNLGLKEQREEALKIFRLNFPGMPLDV